MTRPPSLDDLAVGRLLARVAERTGFRVDAIRPEAVRRAAEQELARGGGIDALHAALAAGDERLASVFGEAVSVGETYFFRQPEHWDLIARKVLPEHLASGARTLRAWSAGCASGEEAYSLAAVALASAGGVLDRIEVLGTDRSARNVERARRGVYGSSSVRPSGPMLYPILRGAGEGSFEVVDAVREVTSFAVHDVLAPPPVGAGPFDLILCRNVLIYFSPRAAATARRHLASALAEAGTIVFGTLEVGEPEPGLVRVGPPEAAAFARRRAPAHAPAAVADRAKATPPPLPVRVERERLPVPDPAIERHLAALASIERGDLDAAGATLASVARAAPGYVPGLVELALVRTRLGAVSEAAALMRRVLSLTEGLPEGQALAAPAPMPASFYRASARAWLETHGARTC